jgi:hypothetical protein
MDTYECRWLQERQQALYAERAALAIAQGELLKRQAELSAAELDIQLLAATQESTAAQRAGNLTARQSLAANLIAKCALHIKNDRMLVLSNTHSDRIFWHMSLQS